MNTKNNKYQKVVRSLCLTVFLSGQLLNFSLPVPAQAAAVSPPALFANQADDAMAEKLKQKISLDYKDADLNNVLRSLSWTYQLNIVTTPEMKGKVTINLQDVSVEKALEAVLTINNLSYSIRDGIIFVSGADAQSADLVSEVIPLYYSKAVDAQNIVRKVISAKGDVKIDEIANSIIIIDYPANIQKAKEILYKIDFPPRQVLIEAKIMDITSTDLKAIGTKWSIDYDPKKGMFGRNTTVNEQLTGTLDMASASTALTGGQFTLSALTLKNINITGVLDALTKQGKANLLASPSIAVLNGQEARIIIGERYPYKERTQTTTGTTETTKFIDIGTTLRVTPQINDDGYITMRVHPEVSSLYASLDAGPRITTREADTMVRVKEGETLVIGGLTKQKKDSTRERIPILGHIPLIGFLFSRSEHDMEQKELAVFITPKILYSQEEKELLGKGQSEKELSDLSVVRTSELNATQKMFQDALELEWGTGVISANKSEATRKMRAITLYENIYFNYPHSYRAPEALFSAGKIYYRYFKDYDKAKEIFTRVISDFPDTASAKKARVIYKAITGVQDSKERSVQRKNQVKLVSQEKTMQNFERRKELEETRISKLKAEQDLYFMRLRQSEEAKVIQQKAAQQMQEQKKQEFSRNKDLENAARKHFDNGNDLYNQGKVKEAKEEWIKVLELTSQLK